MTSVRTTLVTLQNHPRVCGAVLCCAIISLSNFLFSIAWLIWLQRLGHNYSTFYSHSVFHQSYFLENFDSGTIIIWNSLKNDMDEVNLSVYLHIYSYLSECWKYEWRYSGEGILSLAATGDVDLWRPQQRSGGGESVCKHTFTWTWSNQCNCRYQTARNNHMETNISISAFYQSRYTAFVFMDI